MAHVGFRVAAVQLRIDPDTVLSEEGFRTCVHRAVERASDGFRPHLIVFPEYASVFLALVPYARSVRESGTVSECFQRIARDEPGLRNTGDIFLRRADDVEAVVRSVFGSLARAHDTCILAGSYFARHTAGRTEELRNRAVMFGPDGAPMYVQDKVSLTEFETGVLGVRPGRMEDAALCRIGNRRLALTLCRDSFQPSWEDRFRGAELWIDIKANGVPFTDEERMSFAGGVPARLAGSGARWGLTVCLVGRFLDLMWEGESSLVERGPSGVITIARSVSARDQEVLLLSLGE
jgi:predicted amidohydrolase